MTETTVLKNILDDVMEPIFRRQPIKIFLNRFDKWVFFISLGLLILGIISALLFSFVPWPETQWSWYARLYRWFWFFFSVGGLVMLILLVISWYKPILRSIFHPTVHDKTFPPVGGNLPDIFKNQGVAPKMADLS